MKQIRLPKHSSSKDRRRFGQPVTAGIGRIVPGERLAESYEQADKALSAGIGDKQAVFEEDLKLDMCIADIAPGTRSEFSRRVLKHVLGREELLDTLRAFSTGNYR